MKRERVFSFNFSLVQKVFFVFFLPLLLLCLKSLLNIKIFKKEQELFPSSRGGLEVEHLLHKKCHSAPVDRIPLGENIPAMSMFYFYKVPTLTDVCYNYELFLTTFAALKKQKCPLKMTTYKEFLTMTMM